MGFGVSACDQGTKSDVALIRPLAYYNNNGHSFHLACVHSSRLSCRYIMPVSNNFAGTPANMTVSDLALAYPYNSMHMC